MKTTSIWAIIVALSCGRSALSASPADVSLDGEWDFTYTGTSMEKVPDPPPDSAFDARIKVSGQWDDQLDRFKQSKWWPQAVFTTSLGPVQYLSGIGWHRKAIDVPADWAGRAITLTVGGAVGNTHVWLNGQHVGMYQYGVYTPYVLDLTNQLKPGQKNQLLVAVDNAAPNDYGGWTFIGNSGMASGLARSVTLHVAAGSGRIADLYIRPGDDLKEVEWQLDLECPASEKQMSASKMAWTIRDPKSDQELRQGEVDIPAFSKRQHLTWKARVAQIKPWSDREPNLYRTELRWMAADGRMIDTHEQRFGLRRWSYQGRKLFLNGEPHYLRLEFGAHYFPIHATTPMSKDFWLEHMKRLKELGLNGINFAARVCPPEMLEAADEVGVILQCGDQVTRDQGRTDYKEVWEDIVRTTRVYPSMCIYGFGGELQYYEGVIEQYQRQRDLILSLHPESLVMPQQAIHGIDYGIENPDDKEVKRTPFLHHAGRLARYTEACDLFGHYSGGVFSHGYFSTPWRGVERRFTIYSKPVVAHELFLSASYLNPNNMAKYTGRIPPYLYTRLEKDLKEAGLIDKWPTYVDVTSRLQHICRKYCMEKERKCDGLAGFELLGMADQHFITPEYAVGIVDEFLAMKPGDTFEGVRRYCNESVLLLDFDNGNSINRCYWEGEPFQADVMVSLYGPNPVEEGKLTWTLKRGAATLLQGAEKVSMVSNGRVSTLKKLELTWPKVEQTERLNLAVRLDDSGYALANDWDFWVFPKKEPPPVRAAVERKWRSTLEPRYKGLTPPADDSKERLRIVSGLRETDVKHMEQRGDVLLLGTAPFTAYTKWPSFYPAKGYRPFSNGGTILAKHPVFASHPNEGWGDWLFYPLMNGANCVLFDGALDTKFDPIMEIVSSAGHVRKQALVFEKRVGKGRLLVSTLVFDMRNPSCVTFMDSLLGYVQGDEFQPRDSIAPSQLKNLLTPPEDPGNVLTDPGFEKSGHWMTEAGHHELDGTTAHSGKRALKLIVTESDLRANRGFSSGVSARNFAFKGNPRRLKLSAWFKADLRGQGPGPQITVNLRYQDAYIRAGTFNITMTENGDEWHYVERIFELDGRITTANVSIDLTGRAGSAWIDDVCFGEALGGPIAQTSEAPADVEWRNRQVTQKFESPRWFRVDQGEWTQGDAVTVDREGIHRLSVKQSKDGDDVQESKVYIDLTPPIVTVDMEPDLQQEAGIFTGTANTVYTVSAADGLSGVKQIEVSIDGKTFTPYTKPFTLPPGRHALKCRATDHAGNQSSKMTGEWISGTDSDVLEVEIAPAGR